MSVFDNIRLSCNKTFSQEWDDMLNYLLDNAEIVSFSKYRITFKLLIGTVDKSIFFIKYKKNIYRNYTVYIGNKDLSYGHLYIVDGNDVPDNLQFSASNDTMKRLFELENKLINPLMSNIYKIPN